MNDVFVEFDPFNFSVKDFDTGMHLMRCSISDKLYPLSSRPYSITHPYSTFVALSNEVLHNRLGYPGAQVLNSLHRNNFLTYNKFWNNFFCHSHPLGKQIKFPFL